MFWWQKPLYEYEIVFSFPDVDQNQLLRYLSYLLVNNAYLLKNLSNSSGRVSLKQTKLSRVGYQNDFVTE